MSFCGVSNCAQNSVPSNPNGAFQHSYQFVQIRYAFVQNRENALGRTGFCAAILLILLSSCTCFCTRIQLRLFFSSSECTVLRPTFSIWAIILSISRKRVSSCLVYGSCEG